MISNLIDTLQVASDRHARPASSADSTSWIRAIGWRCDRWLYRRTSDNPLRLRCVNLWHNARKLPSVSRHRADDGGLARFCRSCNTGRRPNRCSTDTTAILKMTATTRLPEARLRYTTNKVAPRRWPATNTSCNYPRNGSISRSTGLSCSRSQPVRGVQVDADFRRDLLSVEEIFLSQPDAQEIGPHEVSDRIASLLLAEDLRACEQLQRLLAGTVRKACTKRRLAIFNDLLPRYDLAFLFSQIRN
jgi:hypothetical protein